MSQLLYRLVLWLAFFLIPLYLLHRARKQVAYRQHWLERLGFYPPFISTQPTLWLHAVSVGETRAAKPLIDALLTAYPTHHIILTQMTPTGRETAQALFPQQVTVAYLPYDYPSAIQRFLRHFHPQFGILLETEIWPHLIHTCADQKIPLFLVNARLSEKSLRGYLKISSLITPAMNKLTAIAAQTEADAIRLSQLGTAPIQVCGNLKFDHVPDHTQILQGQNWKKKLHRPTILFASSRVGEETLLLHYIATHALLKDTLFIIVPRHPQRFNQVANLISQYQLPFIRRSAWHGEAILSDVSILLGDSMGEMASYYSCADIALMGGSFAPLGGQNLIEAAMLNTPTIVGPHMFNFTAATYHAVEAGACRQVTDLEEAVTLAISLLKAPQALIPMQQAAQQFAQTHRGAVKKTMDLLQQILADSKNQ
jgi:3-deoxy-D-manno-octulosonic-acid transferase